MIRDRTTLTVFLKIFVITLFFICVFLLLFASSMQRVLDHDEHQFVASAKLFSDEGLIPYLDYPYFHTPYLVFLYAFLFKYTSYLLFSARMVSVTSAFLTLALLFFVCMRVFDYFSFAWRGTLAMGLVVLVASSDLFVYASALSWNHALPVLLCVGAIILINEGVFKRPLGVRVFFSGVLIGLSIGVRLSFVSLIGSFLLMIYFYPGIEEQEERLSLLAWFISGCIVALYPVFFNFLTSPERFVFGNFGYARLNTLYRQEMGFSQAMTFAGKFLYVTKEVFSKMSNVMLVGGYLIVTMANVFLKRLAFRKSFNSVFIVIALTCLLIASFAPTPSWYQYFYAPLPIMALGIIFGIKDLVNYKRRKWVLACVLSFVAVSYCFGAFKPILLPSYVSGSTFTPREWEPVKIHRVGKELASRVGGGKVLTLAPIFALEGGRLIYKEFATGPFAWRTAHLLDSDDRTKYSLISEADLFPFLEKERPQGILVGFEGTIEAPLIIYAMKKGYKKIKLARGTLFLLEAKR